MAKSKTVKATKNGKAKPHRVSWRDETAIRLLRLVIAEKITTDEVAKKLGSNPFFVRDQAGRLRRRLNLKPAHAKA